MNRGPFFSLCVLSLGLFLAFQAEGKLQPSFADVLNTAQKNMSLIIRSLSGTAWTTAFAMQSNLNLIFL